MLCRCGVSLVGLALIKSVLEYDQLTWQEVGWQGREWRLSGGSVGHEGTETAHFSLIAVCPTEMLSFAGLRLCSPGHKMD